MAAKVYEDLPESVYKQMQGQTLVLLHTVDAESGAPTSSAISWVYAPNNRTIRFAIDQRSCIVSNVANQPLVAVTVFADSCIYAVSGRVDLLAQPLEGVPFKLAGFDLTIEAVRDAMFYGSKLSTQPSFEKTYDERAAEKLDNQVFAALKSL